MYLDVHRQEISRIYKKLRVMVSIFAILYFPWLRIYDPEKFLLQAISLFSSSFRSDFSLLPLLYRFIIIAKQFFDKGTKWKNASF